MNTASFLIKQKIKKEAAALSLHCVGICALPFSSALKQLLRKGGSIPLCPDSPDLRTDAEALLPGVRCAIVILFPYGPPSLQKSNIAAYAQLTDYHLVSRLYLNRLKKFLADQYPHDAFYAAADTSPLCDRWLAYGAGLGFWGKNHCLINPVYGSWVTIGTLLTTLDLPPDRPVPQQCGTCSACLSACPGQALHDSGPMDPWRCKSWLTQKKGPLTSEETDIIRRTPLIFGCDACQLACPWNRTALASPIPEYKTSRITCLMRKDIESLSNKNFKLKFGTYPFSWRGKKILLRNLAIQASAKSDFPSSCPDKDADQPVR